MIAERPTIPTTTPAAMPAVLGLLPSVEGAAADGLAEGVLTGATEVDVGPAGFEEELDEGWK
jgi:hypothetical protein